MNFRFHEGSRVTVREDHPEFGLCAGTEGTVWACYNRVPAAYEVTFLVDDGSAFDALMNEDEIESSSLGDVNVSDSRPSVSKSA